MPVLALLMFALSSGGTGPPGLDATAQAGGSQRALGDSRVLSFRRPAVTDTVTDTATGFSLQRGEKLRQGARYLDKHPQGEPLIREMARKDGYEDSKDRFLPAPYLPYKTSVALYMNKLLRIGWAVGWRLAISWGVFNAGTFAAGHVQRLRGQTWGMPVSWVLSVKYSFYTFCVLAVGLAVFAALDQRGRRWPAVVGTGLLCIALASAWYGAWWGQ